MFGIVYTTSDGEVFENLEKAEAHQKEIEEETKEKEKDARRRKIEEARQVMEDVQRNYHNLVAEFYTDYPEEQEKDAEEAANALVEVLKGFFNDEKF